ncbi:semaphorin-7A-like [Megalops cyprinoides]|uniref:semaphorin-7A-like n=1 Tax=Megalops cyprinoides TaxID=118141 RepID=UPI001864FAD9|nr:semaphorin-7A-like [Megalops cyprinoides]
MVRFYMWIFLTVFPFKAADSNLTPRVRLTEREVNFRKWGLPGNTVRTELVQGPQGNSLYIGGHGKLFYVVFDGPIFSKEVDFPKRGDKKSSVNPTASSTCGYDITTLLRANDSHLFVCGTNGYHPQCHFVARDPFGSFGESIGAEGIAPFSATEQAPSIYVGNELYAAVNGNANGNSLAIRRLGARSIWPDTSKKEQRYVSMVLSGPREDPVQDRVYTFLVERNSDKHPEAGIWTSWVTQVCTADIGGTKSILQKSWTSRLSARLSCGIREKKMYFNQLVDVAVLQAKRWNDSMVYALFNNSWGMSAVCVYTMGDIDRVFTTSKFKGYSSPLPSRRPGVCVSDSTKLPPEVLRLIKDHPEMESPVQPVRGGGPLMVSHRYYRHIRVDGVTGSDGRQHRVLFLSLESGGVHKVLDRDGEAFIIAELQPFPNKTRILNMLLQSSQRKLYVASSSEVVEVDLESCQSYGDQCVACIQARDPYCSWDGTQCTSASSRGIQDVDHGSHTMCTNTDGMASASRNKVQKVLPRSKFFLQCLMFSSHAQYVWEHNGVARECMHAEGSCLLLINSMGPKDDGSYECVASEGGYSRTVAAYYLETESGAGALVASPLASACLLLLLALLG